MKQLFASHAAGWMVLTGLLLSSGHLAGCDTSAPSKKDEAAVVNAPEKAEVVATKEAAPSLTEKVKTLAPEDQKKVDDEKTNAKTLAEVESEASAATTPIVQRLVIASDIKEREPVELTEAKTKEPVVAFVELKNTFEQEGGVIVTFEHEDGQKVGFVELSVPANSPRFRTWARTRNINQPGEWTAVVKSKSGEELARKTFQVES